MTDGPTITEEEAARRQYQAQRDTRVDYLQRWDSEVRHAERQGWDAQRIAADFGKLGLNSALLVNGGALVAIPPLMQWLSNLQRSQVAPLAAWFLGGLFLAAMAVVTAYINFSLQAQAQYAFSIKRALELNAEYEGKALSGDRTHLRATRSHKRFGRATDVSALIALALAISSFAAFGVGAFGFISLSQGDPHAVVSAHPKADIKKH